MRVLTEGRSLGLTFPRRDLTFWGSVAVGLAACLIYLFEPGLSELKVRWQQPEYSHGPLIPLVTLALIWMRGHRLLATRSKGSWLGPALVGIGLLLLLVGRLALGHVFEALALMMVLGGLGLAALGTRAMRYLWVPLAFLLFAVPIPDPAYVKLSIQLQLISSELGAGLLELLGISVFLDGNVIDLGVYKLQVAEACSGLRYLFPLASFGFLCAWLYRARLWARGVLLLSVVPITVLMNSVRIALTGMLVEHGSIELAEGFLHLFEGWVIFLAAIALLFGEMWLLARASGSRIRFMDLLDFDRLAGGRPDEGASNAAAQRRPGAPLFTCLGLLVVAVPAWSVLAGFPQVIPERPGLVTFPMQVSEWQGRAAGLIDEETLEVLGADDYLLLDFTASHAAAPVNFWVAYYRSQGERRWPHSPKDCLPGAGWEFLSLEETRVPSIGADGSDFLVNRAVVAHGDDRMLMYYWYEGRGRQFTNAAWKRYYMLMDMLTLRRSDGALVRLMTPIEPRETIEAADQRLGEIFRLTYPHLEPHVGI